MRLLATVIIGGRPYELVGARGLSAGEAAVAEGAMERGYGAMFYGEEFRLRPVGWVATAEEMEGVRPPELRGSGVEVSTPNTVRVGDGAH